MKLLNNILSKIENLDIILENQQAQEDIINIIKREKKETDKN